MVMTQEELEVLNKARHVLAKKATLPEIEYFRDLCDEVLKFIRGKEAVVNKLQEFPGIAQGEQEIAQAGQMQQEVPQQQFQQQQPQFQPQEPMPQAPAPKGRLNFLGK